MTRFYLRFILIPVSIFTALLLLVHTQPYDDHNLKTWVMPDDCSAPCIMGIQPGITTMLEAVQILRKNTWISQVIPLSNEQRPSQIWWLWNENAPNFLKKGGRSSDGQISATLGDKVGFVSFDTTLEMGDIPLVLGTPDQDAIVLGVPLVIPPAPDIPVLVELWYLKHHLWATGRQSCPYYANLWHMPIHFNVTDVDPSTAVRTVSVLAIPDLKLRSSLRETSQSVCGF